MKTKLFMYAALCFVLVFTLGLMAGCKGSDGAAGAAGASAPTTGTISGVVTAGTGTAGLAGVSVAATSPSSTPSPVISGATATTDASGSYTLSVPGGTYTLTLAKAGYNSSTITVNVANSATTQVSTAMTEASSNFPTSPSIAATQFAGYGTTVTVAGSGSTDANGDPIAYTFKSSDGDKPTITQTGNSASVPMPSFTYAFGGSTMKGSDGHTYKSFPYASDGIASAALISSASTTQGYLVGVAYSAGTSTVFVPADPNYVAGYVPAKRFGILPISDDTRGTRNVTVSVSDGEGGTASASLAIYAAGVQGGVRQTALNVPVYINGGAKNSSFTLTAKPATSNAAVLVTASTGSQVASFTPDVAGNYTVTSGANTITIAAGSYKGVIGGGAYTTKTVTKADGAWYSWAPSATQSSMTFTNWPTVTEHADCSQCHNGTIAPDVFADWSQTVHATFFARGLEGITANNSTCVKCHTVGSNGAGNGDANGNHAKPYMYANNGGYDDQVKASGFDYVKGTGAWSAMTTSFPAAARLSNIQCENCHGPNETDNSSSLHQSTQAATSETAAAAGRISFEANVCGQCHSSSTSHHKYSEWETLNPDNSTSHGPGMGHSKLNQVTSTMYSNVICVRCHTGQGFAKFADQETDPVSPNPGPLAATIDWDMTNVQPQTCQACHDPHSADNPDQLRIYDSIPKIMAGYGVSGMGTGAICASCHNIRTGLECSSAPTSTGVCTPGTYSNTTFLHEDTDTNGAGGVPYGTTVLDTPHDSTATDVFFGRNAYFMGTDYQPMVSKHAAVADTCAGCHLVLNPETYSSHGAAANATHNMFIRDSEKAVVCANCHSSNVDGEGITTAVEDQLSNVDDQLAAHFLTVANNIGGTIYVGKTHTATLVSSLTSTNVTWVGDGQFNVNGTSASMSNITSDASGATPIFGPASIMHKAVWNEMMIANEGSHGIHNPSFVNAVMANTLKALAAAGVTP